MKKILIAVVLGIFLMSFAVPVFALGNYRIIDDFERNADLKKPEWWKFDNVTVMVIKNPPFRPGDRAAKDAGKYSLNIKGNAEDWYCGGIGTYLGIDAASFSGIQLSVNSFAENNGTIRIELYDDDKGSWQTLYDKNWVPIKDDLWSYEQKIDWQGWKEIYIPFTKFSLSNPKKGDGIMNFDQNKGSGGLLQVQLIVIAGSKDGEVNFNVDNIKLISRENLDEDGGDEYK